MAKRLDKIQIALFMIVAGIGIAIPFLCRPELPIMAWFWHWLKTF